MFLCYRHRRKNVLYFVEVLVYVIRQQISENENFPSYILQNYNRCNFLGSEIDSSEVNRPKLPKHSRKCIR